MVIGLLLDGSSEIVVMIIVLCVLLVDQNCLLNNLGDYFEGENGNGNDYVYVIGL